MENTFSFNKSDSGTNGFDVIYRNLDGLGTAKFIGGNKVTSSCRAVTRKGADADLPAAVEGKVYKSNVGTGIFLFKLLAIISNNDFLEKTRKI